MPQHLQKKQTAPKPPAHKNAAAENAGPHSIFLLHRFGPFRMSDSFLVEPTFLFIGSIFP